MFFVTMVILLMSLNTFLNRRFKKPVVVRSQPMSRFFSFCFFFNLPWLAGKSQTLAERVSGFSTARLLVILGCSSVFHLFVEYDLSYF